MGRKNSLRLPARHWHSVAPHGSSLLEASKTKKYTAPGDLYVLLPRCIFWSRLCCAVRNTFFFEGA